MYNINLDYVSPQYHSGAKYGCALAAGIFAGRTALRLTQGLYNKTASLIASSLNNPKLAKDYNKSGDSY